MKVKRVFYLLWVFAAGVLHIFGNEFGTRVIFFASVFVPLIFVGLAWLASRGISFQLSFNKACKVFAKGGGFLPAYAHGVLVFENLYTGEKWEKQLSFSQGRMAVSVELPDEHMHCGMILASLREVSLNDIFGLCGWKVAAAHNATMLKMPARYDIEIDLTSETRSFSDSDEYSMHRPGSDPSETFAIREYIPGDPLKSIHWKLSGKTDKLLVRELGLPVMRRILLLPEVQPVAHTDRLDEIASALYSISHALVMLDVPLTLGWANRHYEQREVSDLAGLDAAFADFLSARPRAFDELPDFSEFSNIFYVDGTRYSVLEI